MVLSASAAPAQFPAQPSGCPASARVKVPQGTVVGTVAHLTSRSRQGHLLPAISSESSPRLLQRFLFQSRSNLEAVYQSINLDSSVLSDHSTCRNRCYWIQSRLTPELLVPWPSTLWTPTLPFRQLSSHYRATNRPALAYDINTQGSKIVLRRSH